MNRYLYLCITPESLISSMLPPEEFGSYMAVGTRKQSRGQVIFFEVDQNVANHLIPWDYVNVRCVPKDDGTPKSSVYLSIYRVLESVPLNALLSLYLVTDDGKTLELKKQDYQPREEAKTHLHLYQELCPVTPLVASSLPPAKYLKYMTDNSLTVANLPKLLFVELTLDKLADNPGSGSAEHLPYSNIGHLRDCLMTLSDEKEKNKKTVNRYFNGTLLYRTLKNGFFVGSKDELLYYPYPSMAELEDKHYEFWRSI